MVTDKLLIGFHVLDDRKLSRFYGGREKRRQVNFKSLEVYVF